MRNVMATISCILFCLCAVNLQADEYEFPSIEVENGHFEQIAERMKDLIRLEWNGPQIRLRRDWDERYKKATAGKTQEQLALEEMLQKGIPEKIAKRHAEMIARARLGGQLRAGNGNADLGMPWFFQRIKGSMGGSSSTGGGRRRRSSFSTADLHGTAIKNESTIRFTFEEINGAQRTFRISDAANGILEFYFFQDESLVRFRQTKDGKIQLAAVDGDATGAIIADDFRSFLVEFPKQANNLLYPLWNRLGVGVPIRETDRRVVSAALQQLRKESHTSIDDIEAVIAQLDSKRYEERRQASEKLTAKVDDYRDEIEAALDNSKISLEAQLQLKKLLKSKPSGGESAEFVSNKRLLQSPKFLIQLLEFVDDVDVEIVVNRLRKVTKQEFGTNLNNWKSWLSESPSNQ